MTNTTTSTIEFKLTKDQILERLLKADHITFQEMITLMDMNPAGVTFPTNPYPLDPSWWMPQVLYSNNT